MELLVVFSIILYKSSFFYSQKSKRDFTQNIIQYRKVLSKVSSDAKFIKIYSIVMLIIYSIMLVASIGLTYLLTGSTDSNFSMSDVEQLQQDIKSTIVIGTLVVSSLSVIFNGLISINASKMEKNPEIDKSTILIVLSILSCICGVIFPVLGIIPIVLSFNIKSLISLTK